MRRRKLLASAGALAATALAGCVVPPASPTAAPSASVTPTARASASPTATAARPSPTVGPPDWPALRSSMRGALVLSADSGYDQARLLYNTRFDAVRPQAIASCASSAD